MILYLESRCYRGMDLIGRLGSRRCENRLTDDPPRPLPRLRAQTEAKSCKTVADAKAIYAKMPAVRSCGGSGEVAEG